MNTLTLFCPRCGKDEDGIAMSISTSMSLSGMTKGYASVTCPECSCNVFQCMHCPFSCEFKPGRYYAKRNMIRHVKRKHSGPIASFLTDDNAGFDYCNDAMEVGDDEICEGYVGDSKFSDVNLLLDETENNVLGQMESILHADVSVAGIIAASLTSYPDKSAGDTSFYTLEEFQPFSKPSNNLYFWQNYIHKEMEGMEHGGLKGLVWRSVRRSDLNTHSHLATKDDAISMFNITNHMLSCSESQQENFVEIIDDCLSRFSHGGSDDACIKFPRKIADVNALCLKGKYGLFNNLPHEEVFEIAGHACISLNEKLSHLLGHGIPIMYMQDHHGVVDEEHINGSPAAKALLQKLKLLNGGKANTAYGYLLFWSDGFLRSFVKQKENSVWILTVTLAEPGLNSTSKYHTHCLAIGRSNQDHTPVIDYYFGPQELQKIRRGVVRYSAIEGRLVNTSFDLLAYSTDRPERSSILKSRHLGNIGQRSLYCGEIDDTKLPYCEACYNKAISDILRIGFLDRWNCGRCWQWDYNSNSAVAKAIELPKNYPSVAAEDSPPHPEHRSVTETYLKSVPLTFDWMKSGVIYACHNIRNGCWNKGQMGAFLASICVQEKIAQLCWDENKPGNMNVDEILITPYPTLWDSGYDIRCFIDPPLHLLFHGIVPSVMAAIHSFLTDHNRLAPFETMVNVHLTKIISFRLDWCKIKKLPKTLWLGEDVLGFTRIITFVYGQFFLCMKLPENLITSTVTLWAIQQLLNSLHVLLSLMMTPRKQDPRILDAHVKLFLSCCQKFATSYYSAEVVPFWATTGNFPSLLNIPGQVEYFGPVCWYWEGSRERYIQTVKCVLVSMRKTTSYFEKKLGLIQKLNIMNWLRDDIRTKHTNEPDNGLTGFYRYQDLTVVRKDIESGEVISAFTFDEGQKDFFVAYGRENESVNCCRITYSVNPRDMRECGLVYRKCIMGEGEMTLKFSDLRETVKSCCLLLPFHETNHVFDGLFGVVFDDWDVINFLGDKGLPGICAWLFRIDSEY